MNMEDSPLGAAVGSGDMGGGGAPEASRAGEITSNVKFSAEGAGFAAVAAYIQDIGQILMSVAKNPVLASMAGGRLGTTVERLVKHISGTGIGGLGGALQYLGTFLRRGSSWGVVIGATISQLAQIYNNIKDIRKEWTTGIFAAPERFIDLREIENIREWRRQLGIAFDKEIVDKIERSYDAITKYERGWEQVFGSADKVREFSKEVGLLSEAIGEDVVNLLTQQFRSLGEAPPLATQRIAQMAITVARSTYDMQSYIETVNRLRGETRLTGGDFESITKAVELFSDKLRTAGGMAAWTWGDFSTFVSGAHRIFSGGKGALSQRAFIAKIAQQNFESLHPQVQEALNEVARQFGEKSFRDLSIGKAAVGMRGLSPDISAYLLRNMKNLPIFQGPGGYLAWEAMGFDLTQYDLLRRKAQPIIGAPKKVSEIMGTDFVHAMEKAMEKLEISKILPSMGAKFDEIKDTIAISNTELKDISDFARDIAQLLGRKPIGDIGPSVDIDTRSIYFSRVTSGF